MINPFPSPYFQFLYYPGRNAKTFNMNICSSIKINNYQHPRSEYNKHLKVEHQKFPPFHPFFALISSSIRIYVTMATQRNGVLPTRTFFSCFVFCSPSPTTSTASSICNLFNQITSYGICFFVIVGQKKVKMY